VDTTVQPKAVTHPTDAKLLNRSRERLVRLAKKQGIVLRQSYQRKGPQAVLKAGRYAHARQMKRMAKEVKRLKTYLGRVIRDIERKAETMPKSLKTELAQAHRLLVQQRKDTNKLYSLHEPHVACISKGKAHKKYEFGNKVSLCVTNKEGFILGVQGWEGHPYDGYTLKGALDQVADLTGTRPERCYVEWLPRPWSDRNKSVSLRSKAQRDTDDQEGTEAPQRHRGSHRASENRRSLIRLLKNN